MKLCFIITIQTNVNCLLKYHLANGLSLFILENSLRLLRIGLKTFYTFFLGKKQNSFLKNKQLSHYFNDLNLKEKHDLINQIIFNCIRTVKIKKLLKILF